MTTRRAWILSAAAAVAAAIAVAAVDVPVARAVGGGVGHELFRVIIRALDVVPNEARRQKVRCGLSTSLAFGGNDAALVMRRIE